MKVRAVVEQQMSHLVDDPDALVPVLHAEWDGDHGRLFSVDRPVGSEEALL